MTILYPLIPIEKTEYKDIVSKIFTEQGIDICVMQEIDVPAGYDESWLSFKGYNLLTECNEIKSRTGIYIKNGIKFTRKTELEGSNTGLVIKILN